MFATSNLTSQDSTVTPQAPAQIKTATPDAPEIKKPAPNMRRIETLSEWELARETSKTWSMEQD